jgi:aryl-phospho-beta-D-glucosidase BglC (GH1 family)
VSAHLRLIAASALLLACEAAPSGPDSGPAIIDAGAADAGLEDVPGLVEVPPPRCDANLGTPPPRTPPTEPVTLPWLRVSGRDLVDEEGTPVSLRGVNLGSWLQTESWMLGLGYGYDDDFLTAMEARAEADGLGDLLASAQRTNALELATESEPRWVLVQGWRAPMWRRAEPARRPAVEAYWRWFDESPWLYEEENLWAYFTRRFGAAAADELRTMLQDRWISEVDLERIAALGLGVVRAPFWYRQLEEELPDGTVRYREDGWRRLDTLIEWARRHHLYVILDLHGAPGGQSVYDHQGLANGGDLWARPECVERTASLWRAVAQRYVDEPHVAAYDLLNEPQSPDVDAWSRVHDAIYRAVREVDTRHVVMAEDGYRGRNGVRSPAELGWDNAMFSVHAYPSWTTPEEYADEIDQTLVRWGEVWDRFECPLYFGELNASAGGSTDPHVQAAAMDAALARIGQRGVHWTPWSWKFHDRSTWGAYHPPEGGRGFFDPTGRDLDAVRARFEAMASEAWEPLVPYVDALRARAADPSVPLDLGAP